MAMIVDAFAGKLVERLAKVIEEKAIMVLGVKDELQRLRRRMERLARVLKDAEKRRIQDEAVKGWVDELKDLMYDADDIIDLCMIQGAGLLHQDESSAATTSTTTRVRCCNFPLLSSCVRSVPLRYEIADQIKSLNDRLTEISDDKDKFNFITSYSKSNDDAYAMNEASSSRQSSSLAEPDIVGWDIRDTTKTLVELLVSPHEHKCRLFAIVGMGGIGKTTLAQQIYNDSVISDHFVLNSWIWVSKSSTSKTDLLKEIIRNIGGSYGESTTVAELQKILSDVLNGKSLFLVLDDVWDADVWIDVIKNPIQITSKCRVLVTTRDRNTAMKMGAIHIHNVNKLPSDFGWELLCKKVFTNNDESDIQRMKDVGIQIVEKCDGLPVAIKAISGVLVTKDRNRREWENVLNSDAWTITRLPEDLRGALYLSYEALPSALKKCFLYCALNFHGCDFDIDDLAPQWIAEGFIKPCGNALMEDVAKDYFMELIRRSFLQPHPRYADMSVCTMHDLLRGLAQSLAGDESFVGDPQDAQSTDSVKRIRRLTLSSERESVSIQHLDSLRRLSISTPPSLNTQVIGSLKCLRLLILNGGKIDNIPNSIGDLVHLRLLDLNHTRIYELPDSLGNLINLQFLLLADCKSLHNLPRSITKLCNLRQLRLKDTTLNYVPKGIGNLEHLNYLSGFIIGDNGIDKGEGCELEELQTLKNLSSLAIHNLEKASGKCASVFSNNTCLKELALGCAPNTSGHIQQQEMDKIVQVLDELSPPPGLNKIIFDKFFGARYPKWMTPSSVSATLPELTYLQLTDCCNCPQLPQLGQLPQLKYLRIEGATAVVSIGREFLGDGELTTSAFPKLEYLLFLNMTNWEEWSLISGEEDNELESSKLLLFPLLISISIKNCPKLKALPRGLNRIRELQIIRTHNLSRVSHLPSLKKLEVHDCPMLECVEKLESLQNLMMTDKQNKSLPEWLISFLQQCEKPHNNQFHLHLRCCFPALKGCLKGHPYWGFLQQVPRLEAYAENKSMYLKYTKEPFSYQTNIDEDIN